MPAQGLDPGILPTVRADRVAALEGLWPHAAVLAIDCPGATWIDAACLSPFQVAVVTEAAVQRGEAILDLRPALGRAQGVLRLTPQGCAGLRLPAGAQVDPLAAILVLAALRERQPVAGLFLPGAGLAADFILSGRASVP